MNPCTAAYSLDPTDPGSLTYLDNLRLLAAKEKGEEFPPDLAEKQLAPLENVAIQVQSTSECSQVVGITLSQSDGENVDSSHTINLGHIIFIIPVSNPDSLLDVAASATLAIHHFNTGDQSILPFIKSLNNSGPLSCTIRFTHEFFDSEQDPMTASRIFLDEVRPRKPPVFFDSDFIPNQNGNEPIDIQVAKPYPTSLVGAQRSVTSQSLATLTGTYSLVQINHASTSTVFDNKDQFPYFGRVVPSNDGSAKATIEFIHDYLGSSFAGVLYERSPFGDLYVNGLQQAATDKVKLEMVAIDADGSDFSSQTPITSAISLLAKTRYNIFYTIVTPSLFEQVMEEAYIQGIAGPGRQWLIGNIPIDFFMKKKYPAGSPLAIALHGSGLIKLGVPSHTDVEDRAVDRFRKVWETLNEPEFKEYFKSKLPRSEERNSFHKVDNYNFSNAPGLISMYMYDAVMSICVSACKLDHINSSPHFSPQQLFEAFKTITFEGVTGTVVMDENASRKHTTVTYTVTNIVANEVDDEGNVSFSLHEPLVYGRDSDTSDEDSYKMGFSYFPKETNEEYGEPKWAPVKDKPSFIYSSSTTTPPLTIPPPEITIISISISVQIMCWILGAVAVITSVSLFIWTLRNKSSRVVQLSQPTFLLLICAGSFLMSLSIVPTSLRSANLDESELNIYCMVTVWFYYIGFFLAFSALLAKTYRLNQLTMRSTLLRLPTQLKSFLLLIGLTILIFIIFLILWTSQNLSPYALMEGTERDSFGRVVVYYVSCDNNDSRVKKLNFLMASVQVFLLIVTIYQGYKSRDLTTDFAEGRHIAYSALIIFEAWIVEIIIHYGRKEIPSAYSMVIAYDAFISSMSILLFVYIPKIIAVHRKEGTPVSFRELSVSLSQYSLEDESEMTNQTNHVISNGNEQTN